jgi:hypothetical protein
VWGACTRVHTPLLKTAVQGSCCSVDLPYNTYPSEQNRLSMCEEYVCVMVSTLQHTSCAGSRPIEYVWRVRMCYGSLCWNRWTVPRGKCRRRRSASRSGPGCNSRDMCSNIRDMCSNFRDMWSQCHRTCSNEGFGTTREMSTEEKRVEKRSSSSSSFAPVRRNSSARREGGADLIRKYFSFVD